MRRLLLRRLLVGGRRALLRGLRRRGGSVGGATHQSSEKASRIRGSRRGLVNLSWKRHLALAGRLLMMLMLSVLVGRRRLLLLLLGRLQRSGTAGRAKLEQVEEARGTLGLRLRAAYGRRRSGREVHTDEGAGAEPKARCLRRWALTWPDECSTGNYSIKSIIR